MKKKVALVSLGCSKNLVDSEVMVHLISNSDYQMTNNEKDADVIIVNTCGFIESAKQESIDAIIEMGSYKTMGKCSAIIASGCLAERYKEELLTEMPELDAVIGTGDYKSILEVLDETLKGKKVIKFGNQEYIDIDSLPRTISTFGASAYIKIAEGCDNRCTYCIIPKLRGRYRSRKLEEIIKEAETLAKSGIKELNVIAQDTTRYGIDIYGEYKIGELLKALAKIDGIEWIRLLYAYPDAFDDQLIDVIATEDKICKYLDIPIQHASDTILKKMARRTTKAQILSLIEKLRERIPNITLRTSLIVGFPGESKEDFEVLQSFVEQMGFDRLGVFTYSREEDTAAYDMENQVEEDVKQKRQEMIMLKQRQISEENNQKMIGKTVKVLIEEVHDNNYTGRSYKDAPEIDGNVLFTSTEKLLPGSFCCVKIKQADEYDLLGEKVNEHCK